MSLEGVESTVLSDRQYRALLDAAKTHREALVVRCCGEIGVRPSELTRLSVGAIEQVRTDPPRYLLRIPAADGGTARTTYVSTTVERELRRYAGSNGLSEDEPLVSVTPRRLQMLVADVAERASERVGDPSLADVSSNDLRRYFAHTALVVHGINPRAVKAAGGWGSFEALEPFLPEPTDAGLVDAFEPVEADSMPPRDGASALADARASARSIDESDVLRSLLEADERYALVRLDAAGDVDRWSKRAESLFGYRADEIVGAHVSTLYDEPTERSDPEHPLTRALEASGCEIDGWRVRTDGTRIPVTELVAPLYDDGRELRGFAVLVRDRSDADRRPEATGAGAGELYGLAERHRSLTEALLEATGHEDVEAATCTELVDGESYDVAWIDRAAISGHSRGRRTARGLDDDRIDRLRPEDHGTTDANESGPAVAVTDDVRATFEDGARFEGRVATVPLRYGETVYGTLSVAAERADAFGDAERTWLETVGRQVGYVIAAIRRRNLLLSDRVVELEFVCRDEGSFFVEAAGRLDCRFVLDSLVPLSETTQLYYVRLEGGPPADVFELAEADPGIGDCRLIETYEDACRLEFVVESSSPTLTLTEYGATVREAAFEGGTATLTAECAADADIRTIVSGLRSAFPASELVGKRDVERPVQTGREFREGLEERLTDRQEAALKAAYSGGYYDWPRESTAEEVADAMGVSSPTLHSHLRKGQRELLRTFFDDPSAEG